MEAFVLRTLPPLPGPKPGSRTRKGREAKAYWDSLTVEQEAWVLRKMRFAEFGSARRRLATRVAACSAAFLGRGRGIRVLEATLTHPYTTRSRLVFLRGRSGGLNTRAERSHKRWVQQADLLCAKDRRDEPAIR